MVLGKLKRLILGKKGEGKPKEKVDLEKTDKTAVKKDKRDKKKRVDEYEIDRQNNNSEDHTEDAVANDDGYDRSNDSGGESEGEERNRRGSFAEGDREDKNDDEDSCECDNEEYDEEEDEAFLGEFVFEEQPKSFSCLSPGEIVAYQEKEIKEIADVFSISTSMSATLLRHFQWKKEKLLQKYLENPQQVCKDAGVPYIATATSPRGLGKSNNFNSMCSICGEDDLTPLTSSYLSCNHIFCNDCWGNYLTTKISEGEPQVHCPHLKCNIHVDDVFIKRLVSPAVYDKYLQFVTKNFVQDNDKVRWCPTPGCNNAISFDQANSTSDSSIVECSCGFKFCFKCHREAHSPASCDQMKQWEQKCQDDSETFNWKTVNCRECPKCSVAVEKNGGCNHMTCRQCKYEWCWVCMRSWKGHNDFYSCNRFEKEMLAQQRGKRSKSKRKKIEDEKERKRAALERYLHYYERFVNHDNSRKLEVELRATAVAKMREMHDIDSTWAEVQFIEKSVAELQDCRNVLKYTYVFAYYFLEDTNQRNVGAAKDLFEYLQEDLEKTTEKLSEIIEDTLKSTEIENAQKLESINQTNLAKTKRENLLNAVAREPLFEIV
jgi:ariadne-1